MGDRIMIIGPDGRRNYVQAVHCTTDNLRMVYNMPGDLFLELFVLPAQSHSLRRFALMAGSDPPSRAQIRTSIGPSMT